MSTLNWLTRDVDLQAANKTEYRLLVEEEKYSYGDSKSGNIIVQGDNLEALKALLPFYAGQVKCIYIDPPYNTGSAFEHYDDNLEHTIWLSMMYPRLKLLKQFLREDGSIWIQIDNNEQAYLAVICDEIFGRKNFVQKISVKRATPAGFKVVNPGPLTVTDYIYLYAKNKENLAYYPHRVAVPYDSNYKFYIDNPNDKPTKWVLKSLVLLLYQKLNFSDWKEARKKWGNSWKIVRDSMLGDLAIEMKDQVVSVRDPHKPSEKIKALMVKSKKERDTVFVIDREYNKPIYIYNGGSLSFYSNKLEVIDGALTPSELITDFWTDINFSGIAKEGGVIFKNSKKPEMLIRRVLQLSTIPGDYVLDSFLGSGTTAAAAHKMGRRYIGVEMGEQAKTHCATRLKKVIDGEQGGISEAVGWKGGGGFRFFTLGEAVFDNERRIKPDISFENLAAHVYFTETKTPLKKHKKKSAFLGVHDGTAYALLYNGILGDKSVNGGNVLTHATLNYIMHEIEAAEKKNGGEFEYDQMVIYGESTRLTHVSLECNNIIFRQTPYDIKVW